MKPRSLRLRRERLVEVARAMARKGLVTGSSGNVSLRLDSGMLITPSGIPYEHFRPGQVIWMDLEGRVLGGSGQSSSEWRMHAAIYRQREDVRAVVHTHSLFATAASFGSALRVVHAEGKTLFEEEIPVSTPAPPGTWELAQAVVEALGRGRAALLAHHGAVAVGSTLREAFLWAEKLEETARLAWELRRQHG